MAWFALSVLILRKIQDSFHILSYYNKLYFANWNLHDKVTQRGNLKIVVSMMMFVY